MKRIFSAAAFRKHEGEAAYRNNPWVKECDGKEIIGEYVNGYAPLEGTSHHCCPHWETVVE